MTNPIATYQQVQRCGYTVPPIVEVLIDAAIKEVEEAQALQRIAERDLQQMFCALFDIWWSNL